MPPVNRVGYQPDKPMVLLGVVTYDPRTGPLFPWQPRYRWKKWGLAKYQAWRRAYRRAKRAALLARLALSGVLTMAHRPRLPPLGQPNCWRPGDAQG